MKKTLDIKKLILLNMPYILLGLFATNFGEAWRMAQGADASEKFLSLVAVLPGALQSFWPSLHPLDLLVGLCCGVGLRLAVARWERLCSSRTSTPMQLDLNTCTGLKQWAGDNHDGQKRKGALLPAVQYR